MQLTPLIEVGSPNSRPPQWITSNDDIRSDRMFRAIASHCPNGGIRRGVMIMEARAVPAHHDLSKVILRMKTTRSEIVHNFGCDPYLGSVGTGASWGLESVLIILPCKLFACR